MKRVPRLLLVAFALSLLLHVVVALVVRPPSPTHENQAEAVSIEHRPATIAMRVMTPPPPPPPRPAPVPSVRASAPPPRKGLGAIGTTGASAPTPAPVVATTTPRPIATATAGCQQATIGAAVVATPGPPDIPLDVRASGTNGTALVNVQLDAGGQVLDANVAQSTGNSSLDVVAVAMARDARYAPAVRDCKPIASAYTFSVKFVAW